MAKLEKTLMQVYRNGCPCFTDKARRAGRLIALVVFAGYGFIGCSTEGAPGRIHFSPDGSTIAYTYVKRIDLPLPPEMPTIYSTVYLQWCQSDDLPACRSLKIDSYGKSYGAFVQGQFNLLFSPDSKRIAVKSPRQLEVVDLATLNRHRLTGPGEMVTSMGWYNNREIVYVIHKKKSGAKSTYGRIRRMYRHIVENGRTDRRLLFEQADYRGNSHDFVSPRGRYILFHSQGYTNGRFCLLDVETRQIRRFSEKGAQCQGVSWKPDGSAVFCLSGREAILVYPKEGRIKNVSDDYDKSFRRFLEFRPDIERLWTPDGGYIVLNSPETGGCLIRPDPWTVSRLGQRLVDHVKKQNQRIYRNPPDSYPYLFVQPYPGWARLWIQLVTDKKPFMPGQTVVLEARNYLVDYEGKRFLQMKSSDSPGGAWTLTSDGKKMVYFNRSIFLDEKTVNLPENEQ